MEIFCKRVLTTKAHTHANTHAHEHTHSHTHELTHTTRMHMHITHKHTCQSYTTHTHTHITHKHMHATFMAITQTQVQPLHNFGLRCMRGMFHRAPTALAQGVARACCIQI